MSGKAAIGRADLLRLLRRKTDAAVALDCLGYRPRRLPASSAPLGATPDSGKQSRADRSAEEESPEVTKPAADAHRQEFLLPVTAQSRDPVAKPRPKEQVKQPISDQQLKARREVVLPPIPPLAPWSRLTHFVRQALGTTRSGRRIDARKLLRRIAAGRPLLELPLREYPGWAPEAVLFLDRSREMTPFDRDLDFMHDRICAERGPAGLRVFDSESVPGPRELAGLRAGTPVLALSAFGQLARLDGVIGAWVAFGELLARRDLPASGLLPCPRQRWRKELAQRWRCAVWDRLARPSRNRGLSALPDERHESGAEALLRLLSPASLIRPGLLRRVRFLLGADADVAAEFDAWHHEDCWDAGREFGLRAVKINDRLEALKELDSPVDLDRRREAAHWIEKYHQHCSDLILGEARLRLEYVGEPTTGGREAVQAAAERMRGMARVKDRADGERTGLPRWFGDVVERMPPDLRGEESVSAGLAAAYCLGEIKEMKWPKGIDQEVAEEVIKSLTDLPAQETEWQLALLGGELHVEPAGRPEPIGLPLARLSARRLQLHLAGEPGLAASSRPLVFGTALDLPRLRSLTLATDRGALYLQREKRPAWARAMGQDRFGFYADVTVYDVEFRLRWIPPGRFRMGEGKEAAEVSHTRGFWLAETQTTQALWLALKQDTDEPGDYLDLAHPVETVSWHECRAFCGKLTEQVAGLSFSLPTEAQWEYACRAGTLTRFNDGSDDGDSMDELGWYWENSGLEGKKQPHPVKGKRPNAWGLYDMHGNVWEWCLDYGLKLKDTLPPDPIGSTTGGQRAVRGGSWNGGARDCRSAFRSADGPGARDDYLGFRLAAGSKLKDKSGAVGWWTEGADAPGPWDRDSVKHPTSAAWPDWASTRKSDAWGVDGRGRLAAFTIKGVEFAFRWIAPGRFLMGSPEDEPGRYDDEGPQHEVILTRGFWMGVFPVTQQQWQIVRGKNPSAFKGPKRPVENVSWQSAVNFARSLNQMIPELAAGLPTEAQWEYACRAGTKTPFHDGESCVDEEALNPQLDKLGWYARNSAVDGDRQTHPVGQLDPNAWGLHDCHGNVWEWCWDGMRKYTDATMTNPVEYKKGSGGLRAVRGGGWSFDARYCRSAIRLAFDPGGRHGYLGFRLAAGLELQASLEAERAKPQMKGAEQP